MIQNEAIKPKPVRASRAEVNYLTATNARALQSRIERYWRARGYLGIKTWLEAGPGLTDNNTEKLMYFVRSNIGPNGFPPRFASGVKKAA